MAILHKDYRVVMDGSFPLWLIKPKGQGQVPASLRGSYTSTSEAIKAIDSLPAKKTKRDDGIKHEKSNVRS